MNLCLELVQKKNPTLPKEDIDNFVSDIYLRLFERIVLKFGEKVDDEALYNINPLLDQDDDDVIFQAMGKYVNIEELCNESFQEIEKTYLK